MPGSHPPGWSGAAGRPGTQPLGSGMPGQMPPIQGGTPSGSGGPRIGVLIATGVVVLALVAGLLFVVLRPKGGETVDPGGDPTHPQPTAQPTQNGGEGGNEEEQSGEIDCLAGNQTAVSVRPGGDNQTAGVVFHIPEEMGFRPNTSYFPYLNDIAARLTSPDEDNQIGVIVGGLPTEAGFQNQEQASKDLFGCLTVSMDSGSGFMGFDVQDTIEQQVGSVPGYATTGVASYKGGEELWTVHTLDSGTQGIWAVVITIQPVDDSVADKKLEEILDSFRA